MTIQQISVFLENRAGQLAEITNVLAQNNIDLRAIHIAETTDYGVLRLIADRAQDAANVLLNNGFILSMTPVVAAAVPDRPGGLAQLLTVLAQADVDIEYMYSMFGRGDGLAYMVFRVKDAEQLETILRSHGVTPAAGPDLGLN